MDNNISSENPITPIYFGKISRLIILILFAFSFFSAVLPNQTAMALLFSSSAYAFICLVISLFPLIRKTLVMTSILVFDSLVFGVLATMEGFGIASISLVLIALISWILNTGLAIAWPIGIFLTTALVSFFYFGQGVDFSIWNFREQITVCIAFLFTLYALYQTFIQLQSTTDELSSLQTNQSQLKLKNYQIAKYLPTPLRDRIARTKEVEATTTRKKMTVFFSDLVGFSQLSEEMEPNDLSRILDSYLSEMADIAEKYEATLDKFIGDGIMIFFGDPKTRGTKEDAEQCVAMALEMQRRMNNLQIQWRQEGILRTLQVRMGINSGFCSVGNFGSNDRMNYTAVGTEVNLASRLETSAKPGEILLSSSTYLLVQDKFLCKSRGDIKVKGFADSIPVFSVSGGRAELDKATNYLNYSSEGFSINIDTDSIPTYDRKKVLEALQAANEVIKRGFRS